MPGALYILFMHRRAVHVAAGDSLCRIRATKEPSGGAWCLDGACWCVFVFEKVVTSNESRLCMPRTWNQSGLLARRGVVHSWDTSSEDSQPGLGRLGTTARAGDPTVPLDSQQCNSLSVTVHALFPSLFEASMLSFLGRLTMVGSSIPAGCHVVPATLRDWAPKTSCM